MLLPSPGELLHGLRKSLAESVLPTLPKGAAAQQLRAALHLLGRLERTWDLTGSHLAQDNADIEAFLANALPAAGPQSLEVLLAHDNAAVPAGFNDPALQSAAVRNLALQRILAEMPDSAELQALFGRMVDRDAAYVGDRPAAQGGAA